MKLKIGLVPSIKENYKNQFSYFLDSKWYNFLNKVYYKPEIFMLTNNNMPKLSLIIFTGGNTSTYYSKKKENYLREKLDKKIFLKAIKRKINCIGICWGAQSIAQIYKCKFLNSKKHVGKHHINLINKNFNKIFKKKYLVNSFHNQVISSIKYPLKKIFLSTDGNIEMYNHQSKKIYGIMWHPERNKKISILDKKIFSKILCN